MLGADAGPRPNQRPLRGADGAPDVDLAALRIQCIWRRRVAQRRVANLARSRWSLNRNALRIQKPWRAYHARLLGRRERAARERRRQRRDAAFERRQMDAFKESLIWRMALCEARATLLQQWWRAQLAAARLRALQTATSAADLRSLRTPGDAALLLAGRAGAVAAGDGGDAAAEDDAPLVEPAADTYAKHDPTPPAGTLRPPIRALPSSGLPNPNVRKEERERRELRLLETEIFVQRTRGSDHAFAITKERERMQNRSATSIQCMYRSRAAREVVAARALTRQDKYMQLSPVKGEQFGGRTVLAHPSPQRPIHAALVPQPPPPRRP